MVARSVPARTGWCRVAGHRYRFVAVGPELRWSCQRGCADAGGVKRYGSAADAARYAAAFDRDGREAMGRRAPLVGLFPLRLWSAWRRRRARRDRVGPPV